MTTPRDRILREGAIILEQMGGVVHKIVVDVSSLGTQIIISGDAPEPGSPEEMAPPMDAPQHWRWLSPVEQLIVDALRAAGGWLTTADIARQTQEAPAGRIRGILTNLVDRGILESDRNRGFRLNLPPHAAEGPASDTSTG